MNCNQHGFIFGKLTSINILESIDIINEYLMNGDKGDIIYLDFIKVFDYCLLVKIKNLVISKKNLKNSKYCKILFNR